MYRRESDGTILVFGLVSRGSQECGITGDRGGRPGIYAPMHTHREFAVNATSTDSVGFQKYVGFRDADASGAKTMNALFACIFVSQLLL